jgi:hypothetical protein
MSDMSILTFYWNLLVYRIGELGLPVDKHLLAYSLIALCVYFLGYLSKRVAGADD